MYKNTFFYYLILFLSFGSFSYALTDDNHGTYVYCECSSGYYYGDVATVFHPAYASVQYASEYTCEVFPSNPTSSYRSSTTYDLNVDSSYDYNQVTQTCIAIPTCNEPQVLNTDNPNNYFCETPFDLNTTNPDGTCKDKFAKNTSDICSPDDDSDGVPNTEDDYPTDSTRTDSGGDGSNSDTGEDCSSYCGIDHWADCVDSISLSSSRTPIAEVGYTDCATCTFRIDEQFGLTCDEFAGVQSEEPLPEVDSCQVESSILGFSFQTYTPNNTACTLLIKANAEGGKGYKFNLPNCSQGATACYYNTKLPDEEITDSNSSDFIDDTAIVSKLDEVKTSIDDLNMPLNSIDDSIKDNTKQLKESLDNNFNELKTVNSKGFGDVQKSVDEGINTLGTKIGDMDNNLGTKLNALTDAVNAKEEYPMESEGVMEIDEAVATSELNGFKDGIVGEFDQKITQAFSEDLFTLFSISIPSVGTCGCTNPTIDLDLSFTSATTTPDLCGTLDSFFAIVRPLLWFVFLVGTLLFFFRRG